MKGSGGHGEKQSRKLEEFIAAMLVQPTVEAAARSAGISYVTAWRWMKDEAVIARYRAARRDAMQHAMARLEQAASGAVECLMEVQSKGESESARVSAARCILETAMRSVELNDIQERLDRLERIAKGGWTDHAQPDHAPPRAARIVNGHV
jgi:hypothetical protein